MSVEERLSALGLTLPVAVAPVANYLPYVVCDDMVIVSGNLPMADGKVAYTGKVGVEISREDGQKAAQLCAINLIAQLKSACGGDLSRVLRLVRLGGFVQCADGFTDHSFIMNGASDLMVAAFGDNGKHARTSIGVNALPLNASVEIELTALIR